MKKKRQILAIIAVVLLLVLCICPLVLALKYPGSSAFRASIACVILIPVVLYAFLLVLRTMKPQKSPLIDSIVFDVGNVLVEFNWESHMEDLGFDKDTIAYLRKNMMHHPLWNEFDRGLRPFNEIEEELCRNNPEYEAQIHLFLSTAEKTIFPLGYAIPWLQELKRAGYKLYILSNWDQPVYESLKDTVLCFEKYMDGAVWSYQHHCIKPEPEIYQKLLDLYHMDPGRSVFLDDRQENLDGAKPFGFNTVLVSSHEAALAGLRALGVKF